MSPCASSPWRIWPLAALLLTGGGAFALACRLTQEPEFARAAHDSLAERVLGAGRVALGQSFYARADDYFHQGVPAQKPGAFDDWFQAVRGRIAPTRHVHVSGNTLAEIMPMLRLATGMDTRNVEAYLVAAYWIGDRGGQPETAVAILREAALNNPGDYRIYLEQGRTYLVERDIRRSALALDAGLRLWPSGRDQHGEEAGLERLQLLGLRGFLHEVAGETEQALALFEQAAALQPDNAALHARVAALRGGEARQDWAREAWEEIFGDRRTCARAGAHEHAEDHEHVHDEHCGHDHGHDDGHDH